jgi:SAM-dependent methyltransferase
MTQRPDSLERERIAQSYNALTQKGYFSDQIGGNERYLGKLMTKLAPQHMTSLLEVGGATGLWAEQLVQQRPTLTHVTTVEISDAAHQYQQRVGTALQGRPNMQLSVIQADFLETAPQLAPADVVASSFVAEYMGDTPAYVRQLYDLTLPGGCVIFADVLTHSGSAGNKITITAMVEGVVLICRAYLREGLAPPISDLLRSSRFYGLYDEAAFKDLTTYHESYRFSKAAWQAEQQKYPGAKFHNLGVVGVLMLPKPR